MTTEEHSKRANGGRDEIQTAIRESIIPNHPGAIFFPHALNLLHATPVDNAKVKIATCIINCPVRRVRVGDAVDDKICECEKKTRQWLVRRCGRWTGTQWEDGVGPCIL